MNFSELKAGDIILFKWKNELFHAAIFTPEVNKISNIVDATSPKGVAMNTLEGLYLNLNKGAMVGNLCGLFPHKIEINVVRSTKLDGQKIAQQAKNWCQKGVTYDVGSLADIMDATKAPFALINKQEQEWNTQKYWDYAQRSKAKLIDNTITPSAFLIFCSCIIVPILNFPQLLVSFFVSLIHYAAEKTDIDKGVNCTGFVLITLAAVALEDEPFDTNTCKNKLGSIANINPKKHNLKQLMDEVFSEPQTFDNLGALDPKVLSSQPYNRETFHAELSSASL